MSSATAFVRFPDGTVLATVYNGTADVLLPLLFPSISEAWDNRHSEKQWQERVDGASEPVVIYSDYGGGFWWNGEATRVAVLSEYCAPWVHDIETHDGQPEWVLEAFSDL